MPEYRRDPLTGGWVIIAPERADRPTEFATQPLPRRLEYCPFCCGNERYTPDAVATYPPRRRQEEQSGWQVRVIANKYPAVIESASLSDIDANGELFVAAPAYGVHEVIIESPQHTASFAELSAEQSYWSFVAYRDRLRELSGKPGLRYGMVFKNCRGGGGATVEHSHSQVLATSLVPVAIQQELRNAADFMKCQRECIFCRMLTRELELAVRVVAASDHFVAFCPFAARFAYEVWILPRQHAARFESANLDDLGELSRLFQGVIRAIEKIFPQAPHNYWIHTTPFDTYIPDHYHWHIECMPRFTPHAGFECGSGCYVNPVAPEEAALALRGAMS